MLINVLLLIVGYIVLGKGFGGRTTYVSLLMSGLTWGLERIIPMNAPMTSQPLMELIFAVSLPAVGSAILFNLDASSGGTDIVAMILRKYTSLNIGRALMCSDLIITLMACVAFGMETGLFCILGLVRSLLVDMVLENINTHKYFQYYHDQTARNRAVYYERAQARRDRTARRRRVHARGPHGADDGDEAPTKRLCCASTSRWLTPTRSC